MVDRLDRVLNWKELFSLFNFKFHRSARHQEDNFWWRRWYNFGISTIKQIQYEIFFIILLDKLFHIRLMYDLQQLKVDWLMWISLGNFGRFFILFEGFFGGVVLENINCYIFFKSNLSLCLHLLSISCLLLRDVFLSACNINVFSNRQSSHFCCSWLYVGACRSIDHWTL